MKVIEHIIDETGFGRMLSRLNYEIVERNHSSGNIGLIGLRTRGEFVAKRLQSAIQKIQDIEIPLGILDVTLYRDDVRQHLVQPVVRATEIAFDITDMNVILVDDVLFTGRTVRSALDALSDLGRPKTIQLAVIVDRGHRELPIRADFIGKAITTSRGQEIRVLLKEIDHIDGIDLISMDN